MKFLTDDIIKQTFFYCDNNNKDAAIAEVDILEFARKIEMICEIEYSRREHKRCVEIVSHMNKEVAKALDNQRPA